MTVIIVLSITWAIGVLPQSLFPGCSVVSLLFFSTGAYLAIHKIDIVSLLQLFKINILIAWILTLISSVFTTRYGSDLDYEKTIVVYNLSIIAGCGSLLVIAADMVHQFPLFQEKRFFAIMSQSTFVIFALHFLFIPILQKISVVMMSSTSSIQQWQGLIIYIVVPTISIGLCVLTNTFISKYKTLKLFFTGGR